MSSLRCRDVVTFLSVEGPYKRARGQTWGAQPYVYYTLTLIQPKTWRGPGPPGPLGDYIPGVLFSITCEVFQRQLIKSLAEKKKKYMLKGLV